MNSLNQNVQGHTVVLKPEAFQEKYRPLPYRVWLVVGGFGAADMTNGRALFCRSLLTGEEVHFDGMVIERLATGDDLAAVEAARHG